VDLVQRNQSWLGLSIEALLISFVGAISFELIGVIQFIPPNKVFKNLGFRLFLYSMIGFERRKYSYIFMAGLDIFSNLELDSLVWWLESLNLVYSADNATFGSSHLHCQWKFSNNSTDSTTSVF